MNRILDISPMVSARSAVYPMDVPFSRQVSHDMTAGDHLTLSSITTTLHVGAHADAPNHYSRDGGGIDTRDLGIYLGPCHVITVDVKGRRICPEDLDLAFIRHPRVLFRTQSFPDPDNWNDDFTSLSPELVEALASRGVRLVGIDTPSVDPADSTGLEAHGTIAGHDMAILEGLVLEAVEPGDYLLIALPLKLEGAEAAPVRAVLVEGGIDGP